METSVGLVETREAVMELGAVNVAGAGAGLLLTESRAARLG